MILKARHSAKQWSPEGFEQFRDSYPATEWQEGATELDWSDAFGNAWLTGARPSASLAIVLTPGLFSEWLPGCFSQARTRFREAGHRCLKTRVLTGRSAGDQASRLAALILRWLRPGERFIWCTHSKGGIDALWALQEHTELRQRCAAAALVQVPVGYSWVIADIEERSRSFGDRALRASMRMPLFARGVTEISPRRSPDLDHWLQSLVAPVPLIHAVSWSLQATSWIDSWHARLNKLRPGHAHDGQFFLADQRLGRMPVVCLPRLDHAQPVLGGLGLDVGRLWMSLATVASREVAD